MEEVPLEKEERDALDEWSVNRRRRCVLLPAWIEMFYRHYCTGWMAGWNDWTVDRKGNQIKQGISRLFTITDNRSRNGITRPVGSHYWHGQRICQSRDRLCSREVNVHCTGLRLLSSNIMALLATAFIYAVF